VLTLRLLGTASIEGSEGPVTGRAAQGRQLALLALLALGRGRVLSRDKLIGLLWPETGPDRARPQLSNALYVLRNALREEVVRSAADGLVLNPDVVTCDVAIFERLLGEGRTAEAVELYRGPLLDGFHLSGSLEFESWRDAERARLDERYATALDALAETEEAQGRFTAAVAWRRRLAAHDRYNGRVALRLMRALDAAGDRAGAIQHARIHATLLREEFDAEPDAEVTAFADRLRREPPPRTAAESAREPATSEPARGPVTPAPAREPPVTAHREQVLLPESAGSRSRLPPRRARSAAVAGLVLVLAAAAAYAGRRATRTAAPPPARSVGVLPFVNMSPDPANTYFSDGLSEQIITALSGIEGLRVAARTSSFALRDRALNVRAIGDTLGVEAVLEGSVRTDGNRLRVVAQLIDAESGYHIWSEQYDRELAHVVTVQDEIANAIATALELRLARGDSARRRPPPALEAYDLYLRGLLLRNSLSADALRQASELFDRAIALEPDFAAAWAAKASVVAPLIYFGNVSQEEALDQLRAQAARALELDPTLGEAHTALAIVQLFFDWDWEGAERSLKRAIELNPNDAHAWHHLGNYHSAMQQDREAIAARERAVELDPLNARTHYILARGYTVVGERERALEQAARATRLDPVHPIALGLGPNMPGGLPDAYLWQGRHEQAVEEYLRVATLRGASAAELDALRDGYAAAGMPGFWRSWLAMDVRHSAGATDALRMAKIWTMIGDTARAMRWLDRAWAERHPALIFLADDLALEPLRSHPRAIEILREMKLSAQ
jgi:TolB-like protein/DNA-binding SARP family transcriptional activator